ncbi:MAG TPA: glycosyltransferase [Candidatus Brocadiaceae bacterium]
MQKTKDSDFTITSKSSVTSKLVINKETSVGIIKQLNHALPLVSVITICRNSEQTIRRCIESVLSQYYTNIEYIIQDGASTDRTLDIIKEYKDDRIKLVSEPDSAGPSEAYFKGLYRCTGDIVGLCWADEEYFPHTVLWGVINLEKNPEVAAIYGDVYATDIDGNIPKGTPNPAPQWDLTKFLCWEIMPNYCSSFFRTSKLKDAGFFEHVHSYYNSKTDPKGCIMYDYYAMVGIKYPILYIPDFVAKFSIHKNQQSSTPKVLFSMIPELVRSFDHVSNAPETPDSIKALRRRAYAGFHLSPIHSLLSNANAFEDAKTMLKRALSYEPDINFLSKVVIDAYNYLNDKCLSNELLEFTDIIIKSALTFPNLHYARTVALSDLGYYKEAIESIRKEQVLQPMHAGLPGLLFKLQLHILLENQFIRDVLDKGILAKYQLREVANILNNLLTTTEIEGKYHFLQGMSSAALASLEDIVNACLSVASEERSQKLINRLKTLAATIVAVRTTRALNDRR